MTRATTSYKPCKDAPPPAYAYRYNDVTPGGLLLRQGSSIFLIILLYSASWPFSPLSWILGAMPGAFFVDRFCCGLILLAALYFQWRIASCTSIVYVHAPVLGEARQTLRNGRLETQSTGEILYAWQPGNYWSYALGEFVLLCIAEYEPFGPNEPLRQAIVLMVMVGLWVVGWSATPRSTRLWAWEQIKTFMFWMILSEVVGFGGGGGYGGRAARRSVRAAPRSHRYG